MTPGRIPADALAHAVDQLRHSGSSIVSEGNEFWGFPRIDVQKVFLAEAAYSAAPKEGERPTMETMTAVVDRYKGVDRGVLFDVYRAAVRDTLAVNSKRLRSEP